MKILFISMPSIHSKRWIDNLASTNNELYWFDILNREKMELNTNVCQITNWQNRKMPYIKGEHFLRKRLPKIYDFLSPFFQVTAGEKLEKIILEIQPDIIHSFEMQACSYPILKTMNNFPKINWIYSSWGSDLYYYKNLKNHNFKIKTVLKRVNYLQTDCFRDIKIAQSLGFLGTSLEVIPGGTGFDLQITEKYKKPISKRKIILVKGYEHQFGRALNVIKVLQELQNQFQELEVVVFGAHKIVINYINDNKLPFKVFDRQELNHNEVIELMGKSLIYIGNSISDGMPNTLLEAIVMGAFPIQSNPGNASAEIINHAENGFLINDPNNLEEITKHIIQAIGNKQLLINANKINCQLSKERLDYETNRQKVIAIYQRI